MDRILLINRKASIPNLDKLNRTEIITKIKPYINELVKSKNIKVLVLIDHCEYLNKNLYKNSDWYFYPVWNQMLVDLKRECLDLHNFAQLCNVFEEITHYPLDVKRNLPTELLLKNRML